MTRNISIAGDYLIINLTASFYSRLKKMLNLNAIFLPGLWYCRGRGRWRWCSSWRRMGNRGTLRLNTWRLPCTTSSRWSATCYSSLRLRYLSRWWHCTKWLSLGIELVIRLCRMDCFCYHNCFSVIFPIKKMFTFLKNLFIILLFFKSLS